MLANFLGKSKPINFILLQFLFFCFFIFDAYSNFFAGVFSFEQLLKCVSILVLFIGIFFLYNFILQKNKLTHDNSYSFFLFSLFIIFLLPSLLQYKVLILCAVHFLFLRKIYSLKTDKNSLEKIFDCSLLLAVAFLLEPFTLVFIVLLYAAIYYHQKITIHTLLTPFIGFIVPIFLYFTYCFWFDKIAVFLQHFNFEIFNNALFPTENNNTWFVCGVLLVTFLSLFIKSPKALSVNNSFKKNWILLGIHFFIAISLLFLIPEKKGSELLFLFFPASIIIANGLELIHKNLIKEVLLISILISVLFARFLL